MGPVPLGSDISVSPYEWQKRILEQMLLAARHQGVPLLIGSAGDTGTNSRVDLYVTMLAQLARKHNLAPFTLGYFYTEVSKSFLQRCFEQGRIIDGVAGEDPLTLDDVDHTDRVVAVAGVHPYLRALHMGADVIVGGRTSSGVLAAAAALYEGFPDPLAYTLGVLLEGDEVWSKPQELLLGTLSPEAVRVTVLHPQHQENDISPAGSFWHPSTVPSYKIFPGGMLDMTTCRYEQENAYTLRITNAAFLPSEEEIRVKLEGAGKIGERFVSIVALHDLSILDHLDPIIEWTRAQVEQRFTGKSYQLSYNVYNTHGIIEGYDTANSRIPDEACVVVEGIAETEQLAEELTVMGAQLLAYAPSITEKSGRTLPTLAFDGLLSAPPAYQWTINHSLTVQDPLELFELHTLTVE